MSALYPSHWGSYLDILMVLLRLSSLFLLVPGFSHDAIPARIKVALAFALSLAIYPVVKPFLEAVPSSVEGIAIYALREIAVGLLMGFTAYITFEAISLAAHFIGSQMGFNTGSMFDPISNTQSTVLVPLKGWLALMVFFSSNLHHQVIQVFAMSFEATHGMTDAVLGSRPLLTFFVGLSTKLFALSIQLAAPFTLLFLACNIAFGVLARLLPQMNILLFSFPITISLGLCALYLLAPEILTFLENVLGEVSSEMVALVRIL